MINLSTDYSIENREKYLTHQNDYFSAVTLNDVLDDIDKEIVKEIDKADVIDEYTISGKYGVTHIRNISSGAKTLLNLHNMIKNKKECYIDITSCGDNAIEVLVKLLKKYETGADINLLTCLKNYISYTPIKMRVDDLYYINCFADVGKSNV